MVAVPTERPLDHQLRVEHHVPEEQKQPEVYLFRRVGWGESCRWLMSAVIYGAVEGRCLPRQ